MSLRTNLRAILRQPGREPAEADSCPRLGGNWLDHTGAAPIAAGWSVMLVAVALAAHAAAEQPLPQRGETWHPLAGSSLHVYADTRSRFVCDFEQEVSSSSGPAVQPLEQADVQHVPGPFGHAVRARRLAYPAAALLDPEEGWFGFWARLDFEPATDAQPRIFMQVGDGPRPPLVLRTDGAGHLLLVLSDDDYASACRMDISTWRHDEWHHLAGWYDRRVKQLWLMADGYGVDSTRMYHNDGLSAADLTTLTLGSGSAGEPSGAIDEVVFSGDSGDYLALAHDLWLLGIAQMAADGRLATAIKPSAWGTAANPVGVAGTVRTFGLETHVPRQPRITDTGLAADPGTAVEWTAFNLQTHPGSPLLHTYGVGNRVAWSSSDPQIADVMLEDNPRTNTKQPPAQSGSGRFELRQPGRCQITATMGGRSWKYDLEVIERDRPDLLVQCISRLPRYRSDGFKDRPAAGDAVEFEVHVANRGFRPSTPAVVPLHIFASGGLTDLDARHALLHEAAQDVPALDVHEQTALRFPWTWRDEPCHVVASIETEQPEISRHNNERGYLTVRSRSIYLLVDREGWKLWHAANNNHTGTFAAEDWLEAQRACWDRLLRESVYPATSPYGVQVRLHIDALIEMAHDPHDWGRNDPGPFWDGGWLCNKDWLNYQWADSVHYSLMHEWGHGAFAGADLYSYSVWRPWFYIRDADGREIAGTPALPIDTDSQRNAGGFIYSSSADHPWGANGRFLTPTMMNRCAPQLHEGFAGHIQHNWTLRQADIWQVHRRGVPLVRNTLRVRDIEGAPLPSAELAIWQQSYGVEQNSGRSFWPDIIKFAGRTDADGQWTYPYETAASYDDPETDRVERVFELAGPLSMARYPWPASPGVWSNNSMQLVGVRKGPWTEYHFLDEAQFWVEAYRHDRLYGNYIIQTNIPAGLGDAETRPFEVAPAPDPNERPVAVAPDVVNCDPGAALEIDAGRSYDPEGKPVHVHWVLGGWRAAWDIRALGGKVDTDQGPVLRFTAPDKACELHVKVYCHDGTRVSEQREVRIIVGSAAPATTQATQPQ